MKIKLKTKIPGPISKRADKKMRKLNGGWGHPVPLLLSAKGNGCYFKDMDGNTFLDFASHVAANPLGYNHPHIKDIVKRHARSPTKIAGQDFYSQEHLDMLEELLKISPKGLNAAFLSNSGAEAVENAMKICMRKFGGVFATSFEYAFHGRTLGALTLTNSKVVQSKRYWQFPAHRIPFDDTAPQELEDTIIREGGEENMSFVIIEPVQGEGGYRIATKHMIKGIRKVTKQHNIPLICDEIQSGLGRTGKWWAFEHYGIKPDVFTSAKALQVGATVASKKLFPDEPSAISSTWGGGSLIDLALGVETIRTIKREKLLKNCERMGNYLVKELQALSEIFPELLNPRGLGLMCAFDLQDKETRDRIHARLLDRGLITFGAGNKSIRLIPPFIVSKTEIDEAIGVIGDSFSAEAREHKLRHVFLNTGEHPI